MFSLWLRWWAARAVFALAAPGCVGGWHVPSSCWQLQRARPSQVYELPTLARPLATYSGLARSAHLPPRARNCVLVESRYITQSRTVYNQQIAEIPKPSVHCFAKELCCVFMNSSEGRAFACMRVRPSFLVFFSCSVCAFLRLEEPLSVSASIGKTRSVCLHVRKSFGLLRFEKANPFPL